jgi:hypothetical protein
MPLHPDVVACHDEELATSSPDVASRRPRIEGSATQPSYPAANGMKTRGFASPAFAGFALLGTFAVY